MPVTLDTDSDFDVYDYPITATHTSVSADGSPDIVHETPVTGVAEDAREEVVGMGDVQYAAKRTTFHMRLSTFTAAPDRDDKFTVASGPHAGTWVLFSATKALDGAAYVCPAQRLEA